jgi:hypothetical protein
MDPLDPLDRQAPDDFECRPEALFRIVVDMIELGLEEKKSLRRASHGVQQSVSGHSVHDCTHTFSAWHGPWPEFYSTSKELNSCHGCQAKSLEFWGHATHTLELSASKMVRLSLNFFWLVFDRDIHTEA